MKFANKISTVSQTYSRSISTKSSQDPSFRLKSASEIDPFIHRISLNICDVIQILLMSITIVPIRFISISFLLFFTWILARFGLLFTSKDVRIMQPFIGWRKILQIILRKIFRLIFFFMGFHRIKVIGEQVHSIFFI